MRSAGLSLALEPPGIAVGDRAEAQDRPGSCGRAVPCWRPWADNARDQRRRATFQALGTPKPLTEGLKRSNLPKERRPYGKCRLKWGVDVASGIVRFCGRNGRCKVQILRNGSSTEDNLSIKMTPKREGRT